MDKQKLKDHEFLIGIDLGNATSSIAYFDLKKNTPEVINISGGFGKVTQETALQKIDDEYIFGEHAVTGNSVEYPTILNLIDSDYLELFVEHILSYTCYIDPNASILSITVVLPNEAKHINKIKNAFQQYADITRFIHHNDCVLAYYHHLRKVQKEKIAIIDYGETGFRFSLLSADKTIKHEFYFEDDILAGFHLLDDLLDLLTTLYLQQMNKISTDLTATEQIELKKLLYTNYHHFFSNKNKNIKVYCSFCFPAVTLTITTEHLKEIVYPYQIRLEKLIRYHFQKNMVDISDVETILQTGGGFEMNWPKLVIEELFSDSHMIRCTPSKMMPALGGAIFSASSFDMLSTPLVAEAHQAITYDIGILVNKSVFMSILDNELSVITKNETIDPFTIDLYKKNGTKIKLISVLDVDGIDRSHLTTNLLISAIFVNHSLKVTIIDIGFGDIYKTSGFERTYTIKESYIND